MGRAGRLGGAAVFLASSALRLCPWPHPRRRRWLAGAVSGHCLLRRVAAAADRAGVASCCCRVAGWTSMSAAPKPMSRWGSLVWVTETAMVSRVPDNSSAKPPSAICAAMASIRHVVAWPGADGSLFRCAGRRRPAFIDRLRPGRQQLRAQPARRISTGNRALDGAETASPVRALPRRSGPARRSSRWLRRKQHGRRGSSFLRRQLSRPIVGKAGDAIRARY